MTPDGGRWEPTLMEDIERDDRALAEGIVGAAAPLVGGHDDFDPLLELVGDRTIVLLGEASHGTHEFYRARSEITRRLIVEKGFNAVTAEADWPDAYRVNRFVRDLGKDADAVDALADFRRFPQWMWRNADVLDFVGWLRALNDGRHATNKVGFYGLDLYSLHASMDAVLEYLDRVDPAAAARARVRYACFEHFGADDVQVYGHAATVGLTPTCEDVVVAQLVDLQRRRREYLALGGMVAEDDLFQAEQNARLVRNAEQYYRSMFRGRDTSWNLRDTHMADTLSALVGHLSRRGPAKLVVWAHNSHVGDARHTQMGRRGELNLGQLARERFGEAVLNLGFTTHTGTVSAAGEWGRPVERLAVRPSLPGSYEQLFHDTGLPDFLFGLRHLGEATAGLQIPRLERAIGVIYRPETERASHYFYARLPAQFDAVIHFDVTRAVEPLERMAAWRKDELPETYPSSL